MCALVVLIFAGYYAYYHLGIYFSSDSDEPVSTFMKTDEDTIYMKRDGVYEPFEIRGVNLGVGIPGHFATDYAIDKETYLRWFQWIQELGANTIRVYTILHDDFYNAFYEYNSAREEEGPTTTIFFRLCWTTAKHWWTSSMETGAFPWAADWVPAATARMCPDG